MPCFFDNHHENGCCDNKPRDKTGYNSQQAAYWNEMDGKKITLIFMKDWKEICYYHYECVWYMSLKFHHL